MSINLDRTHKQLQSGCSNDGRILFHPILMMHAAHQYRITYEEFMCDYRKLVAANLKCLELYDHDAVSVISDPFRETSAFGAKLHFQGNNSPRAEKLIRNSEDIKNLTNPDVYAHERTLDRIRGVELFRRELGTKFPVIGWVEGPLAEAADLMGMEDVLMNMIIEPDMVYSLTQKTLQTAKDFARAQIEAGANIIGVGDAICEQIAPDMYEMFSFPLHKELFEFIHAQGALVKMHICGNITHLLPLLAQEDIDILDVDWMVRLDEALKIMGTDTVLCGNLDPVAVIMNGDKELIRQKYEEAKASLPTENWILMGGCEIPMDTPPENIQWLRELSKNG